MSLNVLRRVSFVGLALLTLLPFLNSTLAMGIYPKKTLRFSGQDWIVTPGTGNGNHLDSRNVWVDEQGYLHMVLLPRNGHWVGSELKTVKSFGYGNYRFWVGGHIDSLDENVQFRMTNRTDASKTHASKSKPASGFAIAFTRPDSMKGGLLQYSMCTGARCEKISFPFDLKNDRSTHQLSWAARYSTFLSQDGWLYKQEGRVASWNAPKQPALTYAPITLRLQTIQDKPPVNRKPVEIIFRSFCYNSLPKHANQKQPTPLPARQ